MHAVSSNWLSLLFCTDTNLMALAKASGRAQVWEHHITLTTTDQVPLNKNPAAFQAQADVAKSDAVLKPFKYPVAYVDLCVASCIWHIPRHRSTYFYSEKRFKCCWYRLLFNISGRSYRFVLVCLAKMSRVCRTLTCKNLLLVSPADMAIFKWGLLETSRMLWYVKQSQCINL